jgi:hypothetical protein
MSEFGDNNPSLLKQQDMERAIELEKTALWNCDL